jgi:hypothetical protein
MAYAWRCQRSAKLIFSILELCCKETAIIFCISNHVYHKYKTDFICFNFHAYLGWIISKLSKI